MRTAACAGFVGNIRAVAFDYDGTLAATPRPRSEVLAAIRVARTSGLAVLLVTGRILGELRLDFPDLDDHFDVIVAENGGVIARPGLARRFGGSIDPELIAALGGRDVPFRVGDVLLATSADHGGTVLEEIHRLGLDHQLVYNRSELMVVPAGISKGHGLFEALGDLGISYHNVVAVGDAENDHSLLEQAEIGIAVGNAVDALKRHADVVLDDADGAACAALLNGPLLRGESVLRPRRRSVALGTADDGTTITVPGSFVNVVVTGGVGTGKSFVAGMLAEQLIAQRYSVFVIDPEGDHGSLARLRGVVLVGGSERLPPPATAAALVEHRFSSVVVDLSLLPPADADAFAAALPRHLGAARQHHGLPHWVILDEAHRVLGRPGAPFDVPRKGFCLVTYRPRSLGEEVSASVDYVVLLPGPGEECAEAVAWAAELAAVDRRHLARLVAGAASDEAVLVERAGGCRRFRLARRVTPHARHMHKYAASRLPRHLRFWFRRDEHSLVLEPAANLVEFRDTIAHCDGAVIGHHAGSHDFSRWVAAVMRDPRLAAALESAEELAVTSGVEAGRLAILRAIDEREAARC